MKKIIKILIACCLLLSAFNVNAQVKQKNGMAYDETLDSLKTIYSETGRPIFIKQGVDGKAAFYYCDSNSTATVDGYNVIAITGQTKGRLFLLPLTDGSGIPGSDSISIDFAVDSIVSVPPTSPNTNDRVLIDETAAGVFIGHEKNIAEWGGSSWTYDTAKVGQFLSVAKTDLIYKFDGNHWNLYGLITHPTGDGYSINQHIGPNDNFDLFLQTKKVNRLRITKTGKFQFNNVDSISTGIQAVYVLGTDGFMHKAAFATGITDTTALHAEIVQNSNAIGKNTDSITAHNTRINNEAVARYNKDVASIAVAGTTTKTVTITFNDATTTTTTFTDLTGGGGSSFTRQVITSGTAATVAGGNYIVSIDPSSTLATFALLMPASPSDMDIVKVEFGGTLTSGLIVTALTISPNTGQTILDNTPPGNATADNYLEYQYKTANTTWYRRKP